MGACESPCRFLACSGPLGGKPVMAPTAWVVAGFRARGPIGCRDRVPGAGPPTSLLTWVGPGVGLAD